MIFSGYHKLKVQRYVLDAFLDIYYNDAETSSWIKQEFYANSDINYLTTSFKNY